MNEDSHKAYVEWFRLRVFVSFGVFLSFLAAAGSGIILFLRPEGGLASWTGWNIFRIDKKGWEGIHIISILMFVVFAAAHLGFNWKVLVAYIRRKSAAGKRLRKERIAALAVVLLVFAGAVLRAKPFWIIMGLRSEIKKGTYTVKIQPPAPNAEEMTIAELCAMNNIPELDAVVRLDKAGLQTVDLKTKLAAAAKAGKTTPEKIYSIIIGLP
jgi:hypothetical protein